MQVFDDRFQAESGSNVPFLIFTFVSNLLLSCDAWKCRMVKQLVVRVEVCHYWKYTKLFAIKGPKIIGVICKMIVLKISASILFGATAPPPTQWARPPHLRRFYITHNDAPQSVGLLWTSERLVAQTSTCKHNTHNRQISMPPLGFEPKISAGERPQIYALDGAATGSS